jgi:hypothetical protein
MHMLQYTWAPLSAWAGGMTVGGCAKRVGSKVGAIGEGVEMIVWAAAPVETMVAAKAKNIRRMTAAIHFRSIIVNNYTIITWGGLRKSDCYPKSTNQNNDVLDSINRDIEEGDLLCGDFKGLGDDTHP